jgi:WD40 repeat protein
MARQKGISVFISYARKDGAQLAQRLQRDLAAKGFDAWLDTEDIVGGESWTVAIESAIDASDVVLALLTPASYRSEICRAEQLRSLRKGKCVIPVLAAPRSDIPLHLESKNYRDFASEPTYAKPFRDLLGDIERRNGVALSEGYCSTRVTYVTAPPMVANYVERPAAIRALRDTLFAADACPAIALTALEGMGGIGKTVLAQALCRDEVVQQAFPDGIVWITVGRERTHDLRTWIREIAKALGDDVNRYENDVASENQYRTMIANKAALIVIDDIWSKTDLDPFLAESARSRFLFTTRDASIARFSNAREYRVELLSEPQSRELLALWAGSAAAPLPPAADDIINECGKLPLAVSMVGALLRGATPAEWADTVDLLRRADLTDIEEQLPEGQQSFFRAIEVSVKSLATEAQERYKALAILLEDMPTPLPILETLWNVDESAARRISRYLADRSLAQRDLESGIIRLHDLQLDYIRAQHPDRKALDLIRGAVRLSSNVIEKDPWQFAGQVVGRLLAHEGLPAVQQFMTSLTQGIHSPWLRLLHPTLHPPGGALIRTLEGHSGCVNGVALTPDGRRAVSASLDETLKVWDLETGRALRTLEGHLDKVWGVAVTPDGRRAVSASEDGTLKVWDLDTGRELHSLRGHSASVRAVAVSPDGHRAVSASEDKTLKMWDLETGLELRALEGHSDSVLGVAVSPDGHRAVSASGDHTLKAWDLDTGHELLTMEGHSDSVLGVAVSPDGHRAISASSDHTLKVWDLETGYELLTLRGHTSAVRAVVVSPEGRSAVSASWDYRLKVWDLETGRELRTLEGHSGDARGVAVSPDGRRMVSASGDMTLKVWDLRADYELPLLEGHYSDVRAVAVSPDGRRAVSASWDHTLKVWDLDTGRVSRTLEGHSSYLTGVAVSPDGRRAVSSSGDKTLKVWDLQTGRELRTLRGHLSYVNGVSMSPDGRRAVSSSGDKTLRVWDLETGRALHTLKGHSDHVWGVVVTPDGRRAVSASKDKTLKVWDLETGIELRTLEGHSAEVIAVAVSPDGRRVVSTSADKTLKVWDLEAGREMRTLKGHSAIIQGVAVSPDGRRAVSASWDKTVKVWDLEAGTVVATFTCDGAVRCCAFSGPHRIVAGDNAGRVHLLSLEPTCDN